MTPLRWGWAVLREAAKSFDRDDGTALAGYISFSVLLSFFPFLIFATALAGMLVGPEEGRRMVEMLFELTPANIAEAIEPILRDVIEKDRGGVLTISAIGAVWVASSGVEAFRTAFDRAFDVRRPRNFIFRRLIAIAFVFTGAITFSILSVAVVFGPLLIQAAEAFLGVQTPAALGLARYALALGALIAFLFLLHRYLPSRRMRGIRIWPGIVVTVALWMAAATAFSVYLSYAPSYSVTYGGLAGVIVTLLFFYITGAVIIFGAELNAAVARLGGLLGDED